MFVVFRWWCPYTTGPSPATRICAQAPPGTNSRMVSPIPVNKRFITPPWPPSLYDIALCFTRAAYWPVTGTAAHDNIGAHGTKNILGRHGCAPGHAFDGGCRSTVRPNTGCSARPHQAKRDGFCLDGVDDFFRGEVQNSRSHWIQGRRFAHSPAGADPQAKWPGAGPDDRYGNQFSKWIDPQGNPRQD